MRYFCPVTLLIIILILNNDIKFHSILQNIEIREPYSFYSSFIIVNLRLKITVDFIKGYHSSKTVYFNFLNLMGSYHNQLLTTN